MHTCDDEIEECRSDDNEAVKSSLSVNKGQNSVEDSPNKFIEIIQLDRQHSQGDLGLEDRVLALTEEKNEINRESVGLGA